MPAVNLNRQYRPQSRERRPQLNGAPNIPNVHTGAPVADVAGDYLRATMPALKAQLGIIGAEADRGIAEANRRISDIERRSRAIQGAFSAAGQALDIINRRGEALDRARERQQANDIRHLQNGWKQHELENMKRIREATYSRTVDNDGTTTTTGPYEESIKVGQEFEETEVYKMREGLDEEAKRSFDEWLALERLGLENKAAEYQEKLQQEDITRTHTDAVKLDLEELKSYQDLQDILTWDEKRLQLLKDSDALIKWQRGLTDSAGNTRRPPTPEDVAAIAYAHRKLTDEANKERLRHLANQYTETGAPEILAHLKAWGMTAEEYAGQSGITTDFAPTADTELRDDADRQAVRTMAEEAKDGLQKRYAEEDKAAMHDARVALMDMRKEAGDGPIDAEKINALRKIPFHDRENTHILNDFIDDNLATDNDAAIFRKIGEEVGLKEAPAEGPFAAQREAAKNIRDPKKRAAAIEVIDRVEAAQEFEEWDRRYLNAIDQLERLKGFNENEIAAMQYGIESVVETIGDLRTDAAREMAFKRMAGVQSELGKYYSQMAIDVLNQGWYYKKDGTKEWISDRKAIDIYSRYIPFMTREQMDAVHEAFGKVHVELEKKDFDTLGDWLNTKGIKMADLYLWDEDGKMDEPVFNEQLMANSEVKVLMNGMSEDPKALAREIWVAVEQYKLMQVRLQGRDASGNTKTLRQYLDEYFERNQSRLDWWNKAQTVERVAETRRIFNVLNYTTTYGPFSEAGGDDE